MIIVGDIMDTQMVAVREVATVKEVYMLMRQYAMSEFPVVDGEYHLRGMIYEHNILELLYPQSEFSPNAEALQAEALLTDRVFVSAVMTQRIRATEPSANIVGVGGMMVREKIRTIPVVEGKRLVGMLHQSKIFLTLMRFLLDKGGLPASRADLLSIQKEKTQTRFINNYKGAERRNHDRVPLKVLVAYKRASLQDVGRRKKAQLASVINISIGGLLLHSNEKLEPGLLLQLVFDLSGKDKPVKRLGRVVRCVPDEITGAHQVGIMFLAMSTSERFEIAEYLNKTDSAIPKD